VIHRYLDAAIPENKSRGDFIALSAVRLLFAQQNWKDINEAILEIVHSIVANVMLSFQLKGP
jgi:hypothetical protein